jgi:hypothetical protein
LSDEGGTSYDTHIGEEMKMGGDTIAVDEFVYLVRSITKHRDELEDTKWIRLANNSYHTLLPAVKKSEVHKQTKMKLYKTLIRSVVWYGSEAWMVSQIAEKKCLMNLGEVLRKICGCVLVMDSGETGTITKFVTYTRKWS